MPSALEFALGASPLGRLPIAGDGADLVAVTPGTQPGDLITFEMALGDPPFTPATWTDYSNRIRSLTLSRGRTVETGQYPPGTVTIVVDTSDRVLDPFNEADLIPNVPVRISIIADGNTRRLFYGFVDAVDLGFGFPAIAEATITATDGLKFLARHEFESEAFIVDSNSDEVVDVLDDFGWPSADRAIDTAVRNHEAITTEGNGLAWLDLLTVTEGPTAARFVNRDGKLDWRARRAITNDTRSTTSQLTFSNIEASTGVVRYSDVVAGIDEGTLYNKSVVTRASNSYVGSATNTASIAANGPLTIATSGPFPSDTAADDDATLLVELFKDPRARISGLSLKSCTDDATFDTLVQLDLRDRATVELEHPGGGTDTDVELIVEAITYTVVKDKTGSRFGARYVFGAADRYDDVVTALGTTY